MSDNLFPTFRGLTYPIGKTANWSTIKQESLSKIPKFLGMVSYPTYTFNLTFEYLDDRRIQSDDIHKMVGFVNSQGGMAKDFLFMDDNDNSVIMQQFGTGDGETKTFRLCRNYGGFIEPVFGLLITPTIYVDGIKTTAFTWNTHGLVTFETAPAANKVLTWSGYFYYRCHFASDATEFSNYCSGVWQISELQLQSVKE